MPKVRVHNFSVSLDGYGAGPRQSLEYPLGEGANRLHEWVFETRSGRRMIGEEGGTTDTDDDFITQGEAGIGATIMGRNMFGPIRGPWGTDPWTGWWGDVPPFHHSVFVLTHYSRSPITMQGGTTFHFVDRGIETALREALDAANGKDVRIGGGVSTVQQYLRAGLIDDMHLAVVPALLGSGERLFDGSWAGYECVEFVSSPSVAHVRLSRKAA
ncbi:MAG TPA: dihydrofolate reductase family protein [Chloroflexota bacterium]